MLESVFNKLGIKSVPPVIYTVFTIICFPILMILPAFVLSFELISYFFEGILWFFGVWRCEECEEKYWVRDEKFVEVSVEKYDEFSVPYYLEVEKTVCLSCKTMSKLENKEV